MKLLRKNKVEKRFVRAVFIGLLQDSVSYAFMGIPALSLWVPADKFMGRALRRMGALPHLAIGIDLLLSPSFLLTHPLKTDCDCLGLDS